MICKIEGCGSGTKAKRTKHGLCHRHYMRWWHHGDPQVDKRLRSKPSRNASLDDLHWAAGFLEGEVGVSCNHRKTWCEVLSVSQVEREPLDRLREMFGGTITYRTPKANQQPYFRWDVSGVRARGIMLTLYVLLYSRRQSQIRRALGKKPLLRVVQSPA